VKLFKKIYKFKIHSIYDLKKTHTQNCIETYSPQNNFLIKIFVHTEKIQSHCPLIL